MSLQRLHEASVTMDSEVKYSNILFRLTASHPCCKLPAGLVYMKAHGQMVMVGRSVRTEVERGTIVPVALDCQDERGTKIDRQNQPRSDHVIPIGQCHAGHF